MLWTLLISSRFSTVKRKLQCFLATHRNNPLPSEPAVWKKQNRSQAGSLCRSTQWNWERCSGYSHNWLWLEIYPEAVLWHIAPWYPSISANIHTDCWKLPYSVWRGNWHSNKLIFDFSISQGSLCMKDRRICFSDPFPILLIASTQMITHVLYHNLPILGIFHQFFSVVPNAFVWCLNFRP